MLAILKRRHHISQVNCLGLHTSLKTVETQRIPSINIQLWLVTPPTVSTFIGVSVLDKS